MVVPTDDAPGARPAPDLAAALLEVAREIRETRKILEARGTGAGKGTGDV